MRFWVRLNLKSEKGNAMLMALAIIFMLTSFGTISLMTSVANVQMSAKYRDWSKDYYELDSNAETEVNAINSILEDAETNAQSYMAGQYYLSPTEVPLGDLYIPYSAQSYINGQWTALVEPYLEDMDSEDYRDKQPIFRQDILKRLYYYYASNLLDNNGYTVLTQMNGSDILLGEYKSNLFDPTKPQVLEDGNLAVKLNSHIVNDKKIAVKLNVIFPIYKTLDLTKVVTFQGNPIWTNAITAAGSIGFINGTSTIRGDLFSSNKDESLYLNDNHIIASGIYSDGAQVDIYGNVYSKGNLHIIRSNSEINVKPYPDDFQTALKYNVFADNDDPGLFFDYSDSTVYPTPTNYTYIQEDPTDDSTLYFVNQDIKGGNIYCNSLAVNRTVDDERVDNAVINAEGNVSTWNDIKMNNSIPGSTTDGTASKIIVSKNFIGINAEGHNGDPNASSTVINNTALSGNTITLKGKMIIPGTAWAEYSGVKKNGWPRFLWPDTKPNPINPWLSYQYYQTGESITAKNANIYGAYLSPVINPDPLYNYSYEPYTLDPESEPYVETEINAFNLLRGDAVSGEDQDSLIPKKGQLTDYVMSRILSGTPVVSNVFSGSTVEGYSLGEALLHSTEESPSASVYGGPIPNSNPSANQPNPMTDNELYAHYRAYYFAFQSTLSKIFLSKVQNLGTTKKMPISFENLIDKTKGYVEDLEMDLEYFVDKSAVSDINGNLLAGIKTNPMGMTNSFVYLQPPMGSDTYALNMTDNTSGIIYCEGNLNITGNGTFKGAIVCEGNIILEDDVTITYDKVVIQSVMESDDDAYSFFSKLSGFESPIDKSKGFIDKTALVNDDGSLSVSSDPTGMQKSFVYLQSPTGSETYTLSSGSYSGIIYCEGDLTIEGNVTFNGAIICEGNVTVDGHSTITYDEGIINAVLGTDKNARRFFSPGAMGDSNEFIYETPAYDGAVRQNIVKRFQIVEWKEEQQP